MATTNIPASPYSTAIASHKSVVKVAIPHCRGRWFPMIAIRIGIDRVLSTCKDDTECFSNTRGLALPCVTEFGFKLTEMSDEDIAGSLTVWSSWKWTEHREKAPGGYATAGPPGADTPTQTALRRPLSRLMTKTTSPTTRSKWIRPPPICKLKPRSHRIRRTMKMVQSMVTSRCSFAST